MTKDYRGNDAQIAAWLARTYDLEDEVLSEIRARSRREGLPEIEVGPMDGRHLTVLATATSARRAVEIGALGGYSGTCLLRGMPGDGFLHTLELDPHHAAVAEQSLALAGFADRSRVHVGPAAELLPTLEGEAPFDLVFIDADKEGYPVYLEWATRHLRPGGLAILDNAFLFGQLVDPTAGTDANDAAVHAMRAAHEALADRSRYVATVLPTGEGLAVGVRV